MSSSPPSHPVHPHHHSHHPHHHHPQSIYSASIPLYSSPFTGGGDDDHLQEKLYDSHVALAGQCLAELERDQLRAMVTQLERTVQKLTEERERLRAILGGQGGGMKKSSEDNHRGVNARPPPRPKYSSSYYLPLTETPKLRSIPSFQTPWAVASRTSTTTSSEYSVRNRYVIKRGNGKEGIGTVRGPLHRLNQPYPNCSPSPRPSIVSAAVPRLTLLPNPKPPVTKVPLLSLPLLPPPKLQLHQLK